MKEKKIFDAITEVDDELIEEARVIKLKKQPQTLRKWAAIAACAALVIGVGGSALWRMGAFPLAGSGGRSGHEEGSVFMSYAGPVFPLTLSEATDDLTSERKVDFDFSPYTPRKEEYLSSNGETKTYTRYDSEVIVTDSYTLKNTTGQDLTIAAIYPFAGSLQDSANIVPAVMVNSSETHTTLYAGPYTGSFEGTYGSEGPETERSLNLSHIQSWEGYQVLISNGTYMARAFDEFPQFNQKVTVYEFSELTADHESAVNPTLNMEFTMDYSKTKIFTYGFNGGTVNPDNSYGARHFSVPQDFNPDYGVPRYLIVMGEDITDYALQGYKNGGCDKCEEMDGITATVRRYEITLGEILWNSMQQVNKFFVGYDKRTMFDTISDEMQYGLATELLTDYGILSEKPMERYDSGSLEDIFSEVRSMDRVFYLSFDITIPSGESVTVTASMAKENSFDYDGSGSGNLNVDGYELVTKLGSNLAFTVQTASIQDHDIIEIVHQNFGFDLENGIRSVTLDPTMEHYYLEVRPITDEE